MQGPVITCGNEASREVLVEDSACAGRKHRVSVTRKESPDEAGSIIDPFGLMQFSIVTGLSLRIMPSGAIAVCLTEMVQHNLKAFKINKEAMRD